MRSIFSQPAHGKNALRITAQDPTLGKTGSYSYFLQGFDTTSNRAARSDGFVPRFRDLSIIFASDDVPVDGVPDGITTDALMAVLTDHLEGQIQESTSSVNKRLALGYLESARDILAQDELHFNPSRRRTHRYGRTGTL
jgi:hypothetical protein